MGRPYIAGLRQLLNNELSTVLDSDTLEVLRYLLTHYVVNGSIPVKLSSLNIRCDVVDTCTFTNYGVSLAFKFDRLGSGSNFTGLIVGLFNTTESYRGNVSERRSIHSSEYKAVSSHLRTLSKHTESNRVFLSSKAQELNKTSSFTHVSTVRVNNSPGYLRTGNFTRLSNIEILVNISSVKVKCIILVNRKSVFNHTLSLAKVANTKTVSGK